jgi:hypothetical protein
MEPVSRRLSERPAYSIGAAARSTDVPSNEIRKNGAGEGIRTLDPDLGKVVLYP